MMVPTRKQNVLVIKVLDKKFIKYVKTELESQKVLDKQRKIQNDGTVFTTINGDTDKVIEQPQLKATKILELESQGLVAIETRVVEVEEINEGNCGIEHFFTQFVGKCRKIPDEERSTVIFKLKSLLPKKWTVYPPMVLLNSNTFDNDLWKGEFFGKYDISITEFYSSLLKTCFSKQDETINRVAINKPIPLSTSKASQPENIKRIPLNVLPVYGDFGPEPTDQTIESPTAQDFAKAFWCSSKQNGITQVWAPRYVMFSRGNIKEKIRIIQTFRHIEGNDIVDLYAGIGYFTFCYLVRNCNRIFCWEINPWSVEGLIKGCQANKFPYQVIKADQPWDYDSKAKIFIFNESNEFAPKRFSELQNIKLELTHINLGLLPTSRPSWKISSQLISWFKNTSLPTVVHVHENVTVHDFDLFIETTREEFFNILNNEEQRFIVRFLHLEKIKTYAPDVWHVCIDYSISAA